MHSGEIYVKYINCMLDLNTNLNRFHWLIYISVSIITIKFTVNTRHFRIAHVRYPEGLWIPIHSWIPDSTLDLDSKPIEGRSRITSQIGGIICNICIPTPDNEIL